MAKPIRLLRGGFTAVALGDLDIRLQARMGGRRDEIADLGRDFDHMVSRLQAVLAAQRQLLHDVSHELRSPLVRLQRRVLGLARQSPQRLATSLDRIEREAGRLDELVGEVLALSRLQTQRPGEALERADLNELVRAVADDARFEAQADQRDVTLETGAPLAMPVRRELLQRALENVIRNAVKFTAPGTCVEVRVARDGDQAVIDVDDRGPGVADDELQAIFEPFHRGRHTKESRASASGWRSRSAPCRPIAARSWPRRARTAACGCGSPSRCREPAQPRRRPDSPDGRAAQPAARTASRRAIHTVRPKITQPPAMVDALGRSANTR